MDRLSVDTRTELVGSVMEQDACRRFHSDIPFYLFAGLTCLVAAVIVILNTYSSLQQKAVLAESMQNSKELSQSLYEIQESYGEMGKIAMRFLPESKAPCQDEAFLQDLAMTVGAVSTEFADTRDLVTGYYFHLNAEVSNRDWEVFHDLGNDARMHNSMFLGYLGKEEREHLEKLLEETGQPQWLTVNRTTSDKIYLSCIIPLVYGEQYIGFAGVVVDTGEFKRQYHELTSDLWRRAFLLSSENEIMAHDTLPSGERLEYAENKRFAPLAEAIRQKDSGAVLLREPSDGKIWIYAFDRLPSGQVYVEAQQRAHRVVETNLMVLLMALMAVIVTALMRRRTGAGGTLFDRISKRILRYGSDVHPSRANTNRAVLALHFGCIGSAVFQLLLNLLIANFSWELLAYGLVLLALVVDLRSYRNPELRKTKLFILFILVLSVPLASHFINGTEGSSALVWSLVPVIGSLFLMPTGRARLILYSFVVFLFLYTLVEIFFVGQALPLNLMPIVGSLLFLCFALFSSVSVYVQSSKNDYDALEQTFKELQNTQSLLVQREKMVTLGQLMAGVAHEINTPLGAIKASAETMEASMERVFTAMMRDGARLDETGSGDFFRLVQMYTRSIQEMNSTMLVRKARPAIRSFAQSLEIEDADEMASLLIRLEICNVELLREYEDILRAPGGCEALRLLTVAAPYISCIQTVQYAAAKAGKIVFALRSYSHAGVVGEVLLFDMEKSIENVLTLYHNQMKQNIILQKEYEPELPMISGDLDEIGQVWTNLIQNAIQAMPGGGTLTIRLRDTRDGFAEAQFSDTGSGISEENIQKIFEPFFTTKPLGEGSGLGLDISRKIIVKYGGNIEVRSKPSEGATFIVRLPSVRQQESREAEL